MNEIVPDLEKLASLATLFSNALNPIEQKMFMVFMLKASCEAMGAAEVQTIVKAIAEGAIGDCDDECAECGAPRNEAEDEEENFPADEDLEATIEKARELLRQMLHHDPESEDRDEDDDWSEVIH